MYFAGLMSRHRVSKPDWASLDGASSSVPGPSLESPDPANSADNANDLQPAVLQIYSAVHWVQYIPLRRDMDSCDWQVVTQHGNFTAVRRASLPVSIDVVEYINTIKNNNEEVFAGVDYLTFP